MQWSKFGKSCVWANYPLIKPSSLFHTHTKRPNQQTKKSTPKTKTQKIQKKPTKKEKKIQLQFCNFSVNLFCITNFFPCPDLFPSTEFCFSIFHVEVLSEIDRVSIFMEKTIQVVSSFHFMVLSIHYSCSAFFNSSWGEGVADCTKVILSFLFLETQTLPLGRGK